jgi:sugar transferase (PEP-CTERM/EpsH1 system associated)
VPDRLRILVVSGEPPYPPTYGGARIRLFHLLKQLSPRHDFTLLTLLETQEDRGFVKPLEDYCQRVFSFDSPPATTRPRLCDRVRAPAYRLAFSRQLAEALSNEVRHGRYDLVHIETSRMAVYTPLLGGCRKIIDAVDSSTLHHRNQAALAQGARARLRACCLQFLVTRFERANFRHYDAGVTVAGRDAEVIRQLCPALTVHVIPNGVNPDFFQFNADSPEDPARLIFTGTMDYAPNVDAVVWFTQQILPQIRRAVPEVRFHIVGRNPTPRVLQLAGEHGGVAVEGFAPDLRPHLARSSVYVCPLRTGAGMKNKMLEAMAIGKAIVTTAEGASGNDGRDGEHFRIATSPQDFAEAVTTLLRSPERRHRMGSDARAFVQQHYSWEHSAALFEQLYLDVARNR